eukprot:SM000362S13790  [mRNA]  locus=s362:53583:57514:- [translate_table: standard]
MAYSGSDCSTLEVHPCNNKATSEWPLGVWTYAICAGKCDTSSAMCYCGLGSAFPTREAADPCGFKRGPNMEVLWQEPDVQQLYSTNSTHPGWCNADLREVTAGRQHPLVACPCTLDGRDGQLCDSYTDMFCYSQCSGHGACQDRGFCKASILLVATSCFAVFLLAAVVWPECEDGWYGVDCSIPTADAQLEATKLPLWLQNISQPAGLSGAAPRKELGVMKLRPRPLIYIYELPPTFNMHNLQGRHWKFHCSLRVYEESNFTSWNGYMLYGAEDKTTERWCPQHCAHADEVLVFMCMFSGVEKPAILEALMASEHRTSNAEEADYFYVPMMGACAQVRSPEDSPRFNMKNKHGDLRVWHVADIYQQAYEYIRDTYPYWNRHGGKDHIWTFMFDEGACMAPAAVWSSVLLTSWGNTGVPHNGSTTAYSLDRWDLIPESLRGNHTCYDPAKDIVLPAWKPPNPNPGMVKFHTIPRSRLERPTLFYFNGNLGSQYPWGRPEERYSMGIRQRVAEFFGSVPNKDNRTGLLAEEGVIVSHNRGATYAEDLASSRFCGVFPGDGFSARMEDSILHGCIPVIIQDGIHMAFENFFNYSKFTVRIAEKDIPNLTKILKGYTDDCVDSMLEAVERVWQRWTYSSVVRLEAQRQQKVHPNHEFEWARQNDLLLEDDAIATLIQVLHLKLYNDGWRKGLPLQLRRRDGRDEGLPRRCPSRVGSVLH